MSQPAFFDRYRNQINKVARSSVQMLLMKPAIWGILNVDVQGVEHLETLNSQTAFILVANHTSHFDTPLLFGSLPIRLGSRMATGAAADYFFAHWYLAGSTSLFFNTFPVERRSQDANASDVRRRQGLAGRLLGKEVPLLIYPEGTRSRTGAMGPFHPGSAALCISHVVPAVPAALVGVSAAWPAGTPRWKSGRPPVHVVFGPPMWPNQGETATQFSNRIRDAVIQLHDSTATAYGMPTQAELRARADIAAAIEQQATDEKDTPVDSEN